MTADKGKKVFFILTKIFKYIIALIRKAGNCAGFISAKHRRPPQAYAAAKLTQAGFCGDKKAGSHWLNKINLHLADDWLPSRGNDAERVVQNL